MSVRRPMNLKHRQPWGSILRPVVSFVTKRWLFLLRWSSRLLCGDGLFGPPPTIGELPLERGDGALKIYPPRRIRSGKDWIGRVGGVRQPRVLFLGGNADRENPDKTIEIADKTADLFDFP